MAEPWSSLSVGELQGEMEGLRLPAYRSRQLHAALHRRCVTKWEQITDVSRDVRTMLAETRRLRSVEVQMPPLVARDGTEKVLLRAQDGGLIESVLMRGGSAKAPRYTVCVSSQIGCPVGCSFCASGVGGLVRNLSVAEVTDQVAFFAGRLREQGKSLNNVVFMGMGEPFLNYRRVMSAISRLRDPAGLGMGARRITVSTAGIVPGIRRFTQDGEKRTSPYPFTRPMMNSDAVSFPITTDFRLPRYSVLPESICRRRDGESALSMFCCVTSMTMATLPRNWRTCSSVSVRLCTSISSPGTHSPVAASAEARNRAESFAQILTERGIPATVRNSKGLDIAAACGQLGNCGRQSRAREGSPSRADNHFTVDLDGGLC